jgi:hypothetical protein
LSGATLKLGRTGAIVGGQGTCVTKWRVRRGSIAQTAFAIDGRRLRDADLPSTKSPGTAVRIATLIVQKTTRKVVTIPPFEDRPPELDRVGLTIRSIWRVISACSTRRLREPTGAKPSL